MASILCRSPLLGYLVTTNQGSKVPIRGIWGRVKLVPFEQQFTAALGNRRQGLDMELGEELPGIANWLIQGCMLWRKDGLKPPQLVKQATATYQSEEDTLAEFISEYVIHNGSFGVPHADLFIAYAKWAAKAGIHNTMTSIGLSQKLRERGWQSKRTNKHKVVWQGSSLKSTKNQK